ncbi:MAG TPA: HYR domain-containing protein, partial [Chitinophagales bacterium]|nr:HYR domain-containing protein [Chitinophagales bacterium]
QLFYVFTDSSNNSSVYRLQVTVNDNQPPVINCPGNLTFYITGSDTTALTFYSLPTATDNCDGSLVHPTMVSGFGQFGEHPLGSTTEVYTATDRAGNTSTCSFALIVTDSIKPVITCPGPFYYTTDSLLSYTHVVYTAPTATDNLPGVVSITQLSGKVSGDTASIGSYTSMWKATDVYGNSATCAVQLTVSDREGPNLVCPNNISVQNDNGLCTANVSYTVAPALDNDGHFYTPSIVLGQASGSAFPMGTTNVLYTVADADNNKSYCSFNVTVSDTIPPVFTNCPHDTTVNINPLLCGQSVALPALTGTDNSCFSPVIGLLTSSASGYYEPGTTTQSYQIRDNSGNTNVCTYHVTVVDNNTLSVTCPPNITRNTDPGQCTAYIPYYGTPVITPNYNGSCLTSGLQHDPGPYFPAGTTQLIYTASANGHNAQCSFTVTVTDNEAPHITSPGNIVTDLVPGNCGKVVNFTEPVGTDNCNNGLGTFRIQGLASGSLFPVGTTQETYVVTDLVGHLDTAQFSVTVRDTIAPVIVAPANVSNSTDNMCGMTMTFTEPVGTDNSSCVATYRIAGLAPGDLFPLGATVEKYVACDSAGLTDTCTFTVTVNPIYPLQSNCMDNWVQADPGGQGLIVYYPVPGVPDQYTGQQNPCPNVTVQLLSGLGSGAFFTPGSHLENYQFIVHGTGDTVDCTTNVIVADLDPPIIDCGNTQLYTLAPDSGVCTATMYLPVPTVSDGLNTGPITLVHTVDYVTDTNAAYTFGPGYHTVTFTAYDYASNHASCSYYVNVVDNIRIGNPFNSPITYCENAEVDIDPQLQGYADGLTYQWITTDSNYNYYVYSTDSILHFDRLHLSDQKQYSFRVIDRCGTTQIANDFLLRVTPGPATTMTGLDSIYCVYSNVNVPITVSPAGGTLTGQGITGNTFNPSVAGTGSHTIEYAWYDSNSGCTGISSQIVTVYDTPQVSLFADTLYCINTPAITLPATNRTYTGAGISGSTFTPATAGGGYHTITQTLTEHGCVAHINENIHINPVIPNATITAPATVCQVSGLYNLDVGTAGGNWRGVNLL